MASNKQKRYTIVIEDGIISRKYISKSQYDNIKKEIVKYNDNNKNNYYFGNIDIDRVNNQIIIKKYRKISLNTTLEEIDKSTINYNNEVELKKLYNIDVRNPRHLLVAYRASKDIRTLPIIYKKYNKFLDIKYLKCEFSDLGRDINFLNKLLRDKQIEYSARTSYGDLDYLYALRAKVKNELPHLVDTYPMDKFFNSFINDGGKYSYLRFRLLVNLVIEYNKEMQKEEKLAKEEQNQEIFGQMMIEDMCMNELKSLYEEMKMQSSEGTLSDVYSNKLIKKRK